MFRLRILRRSKTPEIQCRFDRMKTPKRFTTGVEPPLISLLSWAKAGKDSKESREATRSEGDDLEESAARALMRHKGRGRGVRG